MATSISKAQADALANGLLDKIGTSKDELQTPNSFSALILLAGGLVDQAQVNLDAADQNASGALSASLKVLNPEVTGKNVRVDIEALKYYRFLNEGVKGTKGGAGKYSFRNNKVSKKMQESIRKWVIREGLKARTRTGGNPITTRESKRKKITETSRSVAYAISTVVKQKGIKGSNFFTNAVKTTQQKMKDELAKGFKIDIIISLPKKIDGTDTPI